MVYKVTEETINGIANAIRTKTNSTEEIAVQDFAAEILNIETGENTVSAAQSAKNAEASAISAASSAQAAMESAANSVVAIEDAKKWANGEGTVDGDEAYENNAKYYSEISKQHSDDANTYMVEAEAQANESKTFADNASASADAAKESENATKENLDRSVEIIETLEGFNSEAWAVGTRNGVIVSSDDITYQNNAKYWSEVANATATELRDNFGTGYIIAVSCEVLDETEEVTS